jgi:hypothetical protein
MEIKEVQTLFDLIYGYNDMEISNEDVDEGILRIEPKAQNELISPESPINLQNLACAMIKHGILFIELRQDYKNKDFGIILDKDFFESFLFKKYRKLHDE